ncbi:MULTISPECIES: hypothetical protein [unclassified Streptomyces]|uniref:hypothetical protein n=1 Tax=unclassified Streptomyces TaxID=2593676 RepID=UPI0035D70E01
MDIPRFGIPEQLADRMSMAEQHEYLRTRLTRRGALRTGVATAAVAGAGLGTSLAASPAYAAGTVLTSCRRLVPTPRTGDPSQWPVEPPLSRRSRARCRAAAAFLRSDWVGRWV